MSTRLVNRPWPSFSSTTTEPILALLGNITPRLATTRSRSPSPSRSTASACAGARDLGAERRFGEGPARRLPDPDHAVGRHVAGDDVGQAVPVEIDHRDMGDERTVFRRRTAGRRLRAEEPDGAPPAAWRPDRRGPTRTPRRQAGTRRWPRAIRQRRRRAATAQRRPMAILTTTRPATVPRRSRVMRDAADASGG